MVLEAADRLEGLAARRSPDDALREQRWHPAQAPVEEHAESQPADVPTMV
jgi:hypothetical protein